MSAFKEAVAKDNKSVFINLDEFAENHIINGDSVPCIVDKDIIQDAGNAYGGLEYKGVFLNILTIYIAETDIKRRPVEGELLNLDGENYTVQNVSAEQGILSIVAGVYAQ